MIVTRVTIAVGVALYLVLWGFALDGASSLYPILLLPLILVLLILGGSRLTTYLNVTPRSPKFRDRDDDTP